MISPTTSKAFAADDNPWKAASVVACIDAKTLAGVTSVASPTNSNGSTTAGAKAIVAAPAANS